MVKQHWIDHAIFKWDEVKAESNRRKHGVGFEQAVSAFYDPCAFDDPCALVRYDAAHSQEEDRFHLLGMVGTTLVLLVVFTEQDVIRIISARKATRQEVRYYEQHR